MDDVLVELACIVRVEMPVEVSNVAGERGMPSSCCQFKFAGLVVPLV